MPSSSAWLPRPIAAKSRTAAASPPTRIAARLCSGALPQLPGMIASWVGMSLPLLSIHLLLPNVLLYIRVALSTSLALTGKIFCFRISLDMHTHSGRNPLRYNLVEVQNLEKGSLEGCAITFLAIHGSNARPSFLPQSLHFLQLRSWLQLLIRDTFWKGLQYPDGQCLLQA